MNTLRYVLLMLLLSLSLRPVLADEAGMIPHQDIPGVVCSPSQDMGHDQDSARHVAACAIHCALPVMPMTLAFVQMPIRHVHNARLHPVWFGWSTAPPHKPPRPV
jgi:hypothetical protein